MWDEEDGFFYDVLRLPDGRAQRLKVRSMVGLLPLCAVTVFEGELLRAVPGTRADGCGGSSTRGPELRAFIHDPHASSATPAAGSASVLDETKLRRVLARMLDENEFLSPYGIRSLSRYHAEHPYVFRCGEPGVPASSYLPAESDTGHVRRQLELARADLDAGQRADRPRAAAVLLLLRRRLHGRVPDRLRAADDAVPGGRGDRAAARRASSCATKTAAGRSTAARQKFQDDPHWRDLLLFYEYFHGDNGAGLGASHQTGWTGLIATLMQLFATRTAEQALEVPEGTAADTRAVARDIGSLTETSKARRRHLRHLLLRVSVPRDSGWSALQSDRDRPRGRHGARAYRRPPPLNPPPRNPPPLGL